MYRIFFLIILRKIERKINQRIYALSLKFNGGDTFSIICRTKKTPSPHYKLQTTTKTI